MYVLSKLLFVLFLLAVSAIAIPASGQQSKSKLDLKSAEDIAGELRDTLRFNDIDGGLHCLPSDKNRCTVLVFINTTCPIANAYHPTLDRLYREFNDEKFEWVLVHADPDVTLDAARKHQQDYKINVPIALDPSSSIVRHVKAKVTPEAIVVSSKGTVLYRGRIDDRYQDFGRKRPVPTSNDLELALQSIRDGRTILNPETRAVGCVIRSSEASNK